MLLKFVQYTVRRTSSLPYVALVLGLLALSGQAQCLVGGNLASHAVYGGENSGSQDNTERNQLWGNLLEGSQALGDSVCCRESQLACGGNRGNNVSAPDCSSFCSNS